MPNLATLFLREPGKTLIFQTPLAAKTKTLKSLKPGTAIQLKIKGSSFLLFLGKDFVAEIDRTELQQKISYCQLKKYDLEFFVVRMAKKTLDVLVRCNKPVFPAQTMAEIKPFSRHENIVNEESAEEELASIDKSPFETEDADEKLPREDGL